MGQQAAQPIAPGTSATLPTDPNSRSTVWTGPRPTDDWQTTGLWTGPRPTVSGDGGSQPVGSQRAQPGTEKTIAPFYVGAGTAGQDYEKMLEDQYKTVESSTTGRFGDMFSKYIDVANREAGRQASQIGETLGSRGALYSSANLQQQADLRQKTSQDIAKTGAEYQTTLEDQRQKALAPLYTGKAGVATAEYGAREAAMARAYQDFLRRSDVPPMFGAGAQWGAGRPGASYTTQ